MTLLLCLLAGCDGVFGLTHLYPHHEDDDAPDAPLAAEPDARSGCIVDPFDDGITGVLTRWDRFVSAPISISVDASTTELVATIPAGALGDAWVHSLQRLNMVGATATIEVPQAIHGAMSETYFSLIADDANLYFFDVMGGDLWMAMRRTAKDENVMRANYDPIAHRFWRFEHDVAAGVLRFRTSPNGHDWTERHTIPTAVPIGAMTIELGVGAEGQAPTVAAEARLDNFEYCPAP